jgi:hypothetical protein
MFPRKDACLIEHSGLVLVLFFLDCRYIDMAERLCQKRALEAFRLDPEKWGGKTCVHCEFIDKCCTKIYLVIFSSFTTIVSYSICL